MPRPQTIQFSNVSGAIVENTNSRIVACKLNNVSMKFSDVLTQDILYFRRISPGGAVLEEYALNPVLEPTATRFGFVPIKNQMRAGPNEYFQFAFANNDARTLSVPESNYQIEDIE